MTKLKNNIIRIVYFIFASLLWFSISLLPANIDQIKFNHITIEDGLSQNSVYSMLQDSKGFMWFGSSDGLNKFDGYNFTIYNPVFGDPKSLSNNIIWTIFEDHEGMIWVGTEGGGLNRFDRGNEKFTRYLSNPEDPKSLSQNYILSILEDQDDILWIGTQKGLNKLDRKTGTFTRYLNNPSDETSISNNKINAITEDSSGYLWIGTENGLNKFDKKSGKFFKYKHIPTDSQSLSHNHIKRLYIDQSNVMWIGTWGGGLNRYNRERDNFTVYKKEPGEITGEINCISDDFINSIYRDRYDILWIGTQAGGLNKFELKTNRFIHYRENPSDPYSISNDRIESIYCDGMETLWVGTYGGGLNTVNLKKRKFKTVQADPVNKNSLSHNFIRSVFVDSSGTLWVGTEGSGLNRMDQDNNFTHYKHNPGDINSLSNNSVFALNEDRSGILWIGTAGGGLNSLNPQKKQFKNYHHQPSNPSSISFDKIRNLFLDSSDTLWIGTDGGGIDKFNRIDESFTHFKNNPEDPNTISNDRIWSICEEKPGILWIGTYGGGLNRFDIKSQSFRSFQSNLNDASSLSYNHVLSVYKSKSGTLWVGTDGGGINKFNPQSESFTHYKKENGLPNNTIYGILEDDEGNLWMSHNKGLSKFNPDIETFKNYNVEDGLQSNEFNGGVYFKSKRGEMFFGGINGFNRFFPESITDNPYIPPIVITDFQRFNKSISIGEAIDGRKFLNKSITETNEINLSYKDQVFSFEFAALHFDYPEKNEYAYMMEGLESNWNYIGNRRFATFTGLPPGNYTFRVKGSNSDGIWNEKGVAIKITISPPFWKTWWFLSLCGLFVLLGFITLYKRRVRQLKKHKKQLENLVDQRTGELKKVNIELEKLSIVASETDNAVIIMDSEGNLEWVNESFTRMYEITLDQLISQQGGNILEISKNPDIKGAVQKCLTKKESVVYETPNKTGSGKRIWTQTTLTPILNASGGIKNLIAIDSDITKIKEAEMAADKANQSKSEFLARMSHEIRTPMNGVIGFSDMLLDTSLNEEQVDYARTISKSGEALITLLNDILDFSKIEAGELTFDPIDFDPELTVFDICDLIYPRIGSKPIELLCRIGENVPAYIRSDAGRFRQVIVNLMGNASKFTESGEIELSLNVESETENKLKLHISVRDTGIGIPKDKLETVFDVFQQADGSTTRKYGGTGLGLSICKQISHLMDGDVWVERNERAGSTFHFTCWMEKSFKSADGKLHMEYLEGKKALIVDDNLTNLEILAHTLEHSKMTVIQTTKPREVIPILKSHLVTKSPIGICIIDIQMPEFSGYDLAKSIRKLKSPLSKLPLLAFSSSTISRSNKFKKSGFNGFLPKPIRRKKLLTMIERLLGKVDSVEQQEQKSEDLVTQHSIIEEAKHSIRILLVEDNPINLKLATFMLGKAGYQLTAANNGEEAVNIISSNPDNFDLILMDIQMPVMDGRTATKVLRDKGFKHVPIIAMTAEAMKGDREKCLEAGMNDYIPKPIKRDIVFKIVKKWCLEK